MNLSEAEVVVTTQKEIDGNTHEGDWFRLSNYDDMGEFYNACCTYFLDEENPTFRYPAWENIPDILINEKWFCQIFFEIRDAVEQLEESDIEYFISWCNHNGHNIAVDDPYLLVANYQENLIPYPLFEGDESEISDEAYLYQNMTNSYYDTNRYATEIFGENYD